jgi:hypothetical protein
MALSDPQSITITGVANSLPNVSRVDRNATYSKDDGNVVEKITHSVGKARTRHSVRLDLSKVAADVYIPTQYRRLGSSFIFTVDVPNEGFSVTEQKDAVVGLFNQLTATSNAMLIKILGGES